MLVDPATRTTHSGGPRPPLAAPGGRPRTTSMQAPRRAPAATTVAAAGLCAVLAAAPEGKIRSRAQRGLVQRDGVSEAFELSDQALGGAGGVAAVVVVAAEVVVELAG